MTPLLQNSEELDSAIFGDRIQRQAHHHNHTKGSLLNIDKNKIVKPFHTNNIDKQQRQKRDTDDWSDQDNTYDSLDDHLFIITVQGKHFNVTLNHQYILHNNGNSLFNFSYHVPISKYMPDEYVNLIFRWVVEH